MDALGASKKMVYCVAWEAHEGEIDCGGSIGCFWRSGCMSAARPQSLEKNLAPVKKAQEASTGCLARGSEASDICLLLYFVLWSHLDMTGWQVVMPGNGAFYLCWSPDMVGIFL